MSKCKVDECPKAVTATIYCQMHYRRYRLYGDVNFVKKKQRRSSEASNIRHAGNIAFIELTQQKEAIIDANDIETIANYNWYFSSTTGYAYSYKAGTSLHQFLLGAAPFGKYIDHINRNKLDNRRENLRFVTGSEQAFNTDRSDYAALYNFHKASGKYRVYQGSKHLGLFETEKQAKDFVSSWKLLRRHKADTEKRDE